MKSWANDNKKSTNHILLTAAHKCFGNLFDMFVDTYYNKNRLSRFPA